MKHSKLFFLGIAFVAFFFAVTPIASAAPAEALHNTWFELKISSKASAVDADNETLSKETIKTTAYMYVMQDGDGYTYDIICEVDPGMWDTTTSGGSFPFANPTEDNIFMQTKGWEIVTPDGLSMIVALSGQFKLKLKNGELKSASFSILGAYISESRAPQGDLYGAVKIKGKLIDEEKLPFELL